MKSIISTILIASFFIYFSCTPYEFVAKKKQSSEVEKTISKTISQDSSRVIVPSSYSRKYAIIHGLAFGLLGAFVGSQFYSVIREGNFTWQCKEDCLSSETVWIGAGIGFIIGYIGGTRVGYLVAEKKYKTKRNNLEDSNGKDNPNQTNGGEKK